VASFHSLSPIVKIADENGRLHKQQFDEINVQFILRGYYQKYGGRTSLPEQRVVFQRKCIECAKLFNALAVKRSTANLLLSMKEKT